MMCWSAPSMAPSISVSCLGRKRLPNALHVNVTMWLAVYWTNRGVAEAFQTPRIFSCKYQGRRHKRKLRSPKKISEAECTRWSGVCGVFDRVGNVRSARAIRSMARTSVLHWIWGRHRQQPQGAKNTKYWTQVRPAGLQHSWWAGCSLYALVTPTFY